MIQILGGEMNPGVPYYLANLREIPSMYCIPIILLSGCN